MFFWAFISLGLGGCAVRRNRRAETNTAKVALAKANASKTDWSVTQFYDRPFHEFTVQCSHNTYLWGRQSNFPFGVKAQGSTNVTAMTRALELGYRCVELDVWPGDKGQHVKVTHAAKAKVVKKVLHMANTVDLGPFVDAILNWCVQDERNNPGLKFPIIISVENHAGSRNNEDALAWDLQRLGDTRLVRPETFRRNMLMREVVGNQRKIIIKSKAKYDSQDFRSIVAMGKWKEQESQLYRSKSIAVGRNTAASVREFVGLGALVRTYPSPSSTSSVNYEPWEMFKARAQMVCVNWQGECALENMCLAPQRFCNRSDNCDCARDVAFNVERAFDTLGTDGYIYYRPEHDQNWWAQFEMLVKNGTGGRQYVC